MARCPRNEVRIGVGGGSREPRVVEIVGNGVLKRLPFQLSYPPISQPMVVIDCYGVGTRGRSGHHHNNRERYEQFKKRDTSGFLAIDARRAHGGVVELLTLVELGEM